jgi:hypothetical protein
MLAFYVMRFDAVTATLKMVRTPGIATAQDCVLMAAVQTTFFLYRGGHGIW